MAARFLTLLAVLPLVLGAPFTFNVVMPNATLTDKMFLLGDDGALGAWDESKTIEMTTSMDSFPVFTAVVDLELGKTVNYKYGFFNKTTSAVQWEFEKAASTRQVFVNGTTLNEFMGEPTTVWELPPLPVLRQPLRTPKPHPWFDDSMVSTTYLEIDPKVLAKIDGKVDKKKPYYNITSYIFVNGKERAQIDNIGLRLSGDSTLLRAKKSFALKLNIIKGTKYHKLNHLKLRALSQNDPCDSTFMKEKMTTDLIQGLGMKGQRSSYTRLYFNGVYRGLYEILEYIDEDFFLDRYTPEDQKKPDDAGNMYKVVAGLTYLGEDPKDYSHPTNTHIDYKQKIKNPTQGSSFQDVAWFMSQYEKAFRNGTFEEVLPKLFGVSDYLQAMALEVVVSNPDGYWSHDSDNYLLYHNPLDNKFYFQANDFDMCLDSTHSDKVYNYGPSFEFISRVLNVTSFRRIFTEHVRDFLQLFNVDSVWWERAATLHDMLRIPLEKDTFRLLDNKVSMAQFDYCYSHTKYDEQYKCCPLRYLVGQRSAQIKKYLDPEFLWI